MSIQAEEGNTLAKRLSEEGRQCVSLRRREQGPEVKAAVELPSRSSMRRMGQPIDVANAVGFLLSDEAGFINGVSCIWRQVHSAAVLVRSRKREPLLERR